MVFLSAFFAFVLLAVVPVLVSLAGIALLGLLLPKGSRMAFVTLVALLPAAYLVLRTDLRRLQASQVEPAVEAQMQALCKLTTTRRHAELKPGQALFHVTGGRGEAAQLQALLLGLDEKQIKVVALNAGQDAPHAGYVVARRPLPAPPEVSHGIFSVREAASGRLVAERVYAYAVWQSPVRPNRLSHLTCESTEIASQPAQRGDMLHAEPLAAFLRELAKAKPAEVVEVKPGMPYRELESCAPAVRLAEEFSGASRVLARHGDDLVFGMLGPQAPDEFAQYLEERRKRLNQMVRGPEKSYKSKYVTHDLLRCKDYFAGDGSKAVPLLHADGTLEPPERVTAVAGRRK